MSVLITFPRDACIRGMGGDTLRVQKVSMGVDN